MAEQGPLSGQTLEGKYLVGELLGEGGFGMVYAGQHLLLKRPQAIKLLLEHYFRQPKFRERFLQEAQLVATLDHPHIVHIDDFGLEEQVARAYLVMPLLRGGTFAEILKQTRKERRWLEMEQVVSYAEQISSALEYAHQRGIVHLDLKPQNLLVHNDGRLLLADFGLAHLLKQERLEGGTSLKYGTPHYMAPEHIEGNPLKQSDVYAFGVMLYQMLTGQRPFEGKGMMAIMAKQITEPPPPLRKWRSELPQELERVVEKALAKEPAQRYQSPSALLRALKEALVQAQVRKTEEKPLHKVAEEEYARRAEEERVRQAQVPPILHQTASDTSHPLRSITEPGQIAVPQALFPSPVDQPASYLSPLTSIKRLLAPPSLSPLHSLPASSPPPPPQKQKRQPAHVSHMNTSARRQGPIHLRVRRGGVLLAAAILVLIVALGTLVVGPSADVTLTLQAHPFSHTISLTAHTKGQQGTSGSAGTLAAVLQTQVFTLDGRGTATGRVGTPAIGSVTFTNNSTTHMIVVPTHTIVETSDGTRFETEAEIALNLAGTNVGSTIPVPIQALAPGENGNVAAGTITVISPNSLNTLAQVNTVATTELKISVTNDRPTSGGRGTNAAVVVAEDLNTARSNLQKQLQAHVDTWLRQLSSTGVVGIPTITTNLINAPREQQPVDGGTFPVTLTETVNVSLVRTADLQSAIVTQLNNFLQKDAAFGDTIIFTDTRHPVTWSQMKTTNDATSMTLNFTANALAIPNEPQEAIQNAVVGKSISDANAYLSRLPGVEHVMITCFPSFFPGLPFLPSRIQVILVPNVFH